MGFYRKLLVVLAIGGAIVGLGTVGERYMAGMWPPHDSIAYWLAGVNLRQGSEVYGGGSSWFLAFLYAPPVAVVLAPLSLLDPYVFSAALVVLQVAALRYVTGSWIATGLLGWIPAVQFEFIAGNVECLMAASIYAALTGRRWAGIPLALFGIAKFGPALALAGSRRRTWIEFAATALALMALTLPLLHLWPEWIAKLGAREQAEAGWPPLAPRLIAAVLLLALRRPWATALAAGISVPIFYAQSAVLLLPAIRLGVTDAKVRSLGDCLGRRARDVRPRAGVLATERVRHP